MAPIDCARRYLSAGLKVFPVRTDGTKRPAVPHWTPYRDREATDDELRQWFEAENCGIGIACGLGSGGLVVIDHESDGAYREWRTHLGELALALADAPLVRTPGGGWHVYLRCKNPPGGTKLAMDANGETWIETRGSGNYVLAPGGNPAAHESGKPYTWEAFGWLSPFLS